MNSKINSQSYSLAQPNVVSGQLQLQPELANSFGKAPEGKSWSLKLHLRYCFPMLITIWLKDMDKKPP